MAFVRVYGQTVEVQAYQGLAVARTDNPKVPVVIAHEEGTQIAVVADSSGENIHGAVFTDSEGKSLYVQLGETGLPERACAEGYTILFESYTDTTVDVAVVAPNSSVQVFRGINVNSEEIQALSSLASSKPVILEAAETDLWFWVKTGTLAAGIAGCAIAIAVSEGALLPAIAKPCVYAVVSLGLNIVAAINPQLENTSTLIGTTISTFGCVAGQALSCIEVMATVGETVSKSSDETMEQHETTISEARDILVVAVDPPPPETLPGDVKMDFVYIEPGKFTMGSPDSEEGRSNDEVQHEVSITQGFYFGKHEVTQGQWESVMGTTPWSGQDYVQANADHPAVYVSWEDAQAFIQKLNEAAGKTLYALPTEAEWEYACRAGTTTRWSFGDDESQLKDYAWYYDNAWNVDEKYAHKAGTKKPNLWDLFDMHGNVYEWCQDWYGSYSSSAQVDPQGPSSGSSRVRRGGSFIDYFVQYVRSANRYYDPPGLRYADIGFRLLRRANGQPSQSYSISGRVTESGSGLSGVTVTLGGDTTATVTTSDDGSYSFSDLPDGAYTLTPSGEGYTFSPDNLTVTLSRADVTGQNFAGTKTLSGDVKMEFVYIEPGKFMMGSPASEEGRFDDEGPQHEVTISQGFYLGKYEVTQVQWELVMGSNPSEYKGDNRPVEMVSWNDVQVFIDKLNQAAGSELYRLPTEAEWEYACRAGTTTRWSFGDDESQLGEYAWYDGNYVFGGRIGKKGVSHAAFRDASKSKEKQGFSMCAEGFPFRFIGSNEGI